LERLAQGESTTKEINRKKPVVKLGKKGENIGCRGDGRTSECGRTVGVWATKQIMDR
jgi:hypothetical protein